MLYVKQNDRFHLFWAVFRALGWSYKCTSAKSKTKTFCFVNQNTTRAYIIALGVKNLTANILKDTSRKKVPSHCYIVLNKNYLSRKYKWYAALNFDSYYTHTPFSFLYRRFNTRAICQITPQPAVVETNESSSKNHYIRNHNTSVTNPTSLTQITDRRIRLQVGKRSKKQEVVLHSHIQKINAKAIIKKRNECGENC